jgi:glycosyltransferase involved in cell wall biosynthesis
MLWAPVAESGTIARTLRNAGVLARAAARHIEDDPMLFALQSLRRLPAPVRRRVSRLLIEPRRKLSGSTSALFASLGHYLADHPDEARSMLSGTEGGNRLAQRALAELQVALGAEPPPNSHAGVRARAAWQRGDLSAAVEIASAAPSAGVRRYGERLASERDLLTGGYRLPLPSGSAQVHPQPVRVGGAAPSGIRVMHLLTNSLPWTQSGYAVRSHAILRAQSQAGMTVEALTRVGYPVIVGLPQARDLDVVDGVPYRRVVPRRLASTPTGRLEQFADAAVLRAAAFRPDIIHTTTHYPNAVVAQAVAKRCDLPWVYEIRGQLEKTWVASRPGALQAHAANSERYRLAGARESELARASDHVVTLSQSLKDDLVAQRVPPERITLVPNAVDAELLRRPATSAPVARRALGLPEAGFWVGTVSSLVDYEGLDVLLDAVALLRADGVDARCAIVGDGVSRPALVARAARLGLGDSVVFPGRVARTEAVQWHEALDTFVVPRRDTEVCRMVTPLKPIEAMALGRPIVASDLPALAEIVAAPGAGVVAPAGDTRAFADTLHSVFADAAMRQRLAAAGRAFAATRTWQANAERYSDIYRSLGVGR